MDIKLQTCSKGRLHIINTHTKFKEVLTNTVGLIFSCFQWNPRLYSITQPSIFITVYPSQTHVSSFQRLLCLIQYTKINNARKATSFLLHLTNQLYNRKNSIVLLISLSLGISVLKQPMKTETAGKGNSARHISRSPFPSVTYHLIIYVSVEITWKCFYTSICPLKGQAGAYLCP